MAGFTVRALVLHLSKDTVESETALETLVYRLLEAKDTVESSLNVRVDSLRVTAPPPGDPVSLMDTFENVKPEGIIVSIGNLGSTRKSLEYEVKETVSRGFYVGILLEEPSWSHARRLSKLVHEIAEESPDNAARLGVNTLGSPIYTPYYPLSYSPGDRDSVTVALTYPNYLKEAYQNGGFEGLKNAVEHAAKIAVEALNTAAATVKAEPGGVDLSVAPWMDESSLGLAETIAGVRMPKPGFALGVRIVNEAIEMVASKVGAVGFNELQLPVAEDSKLKARVSEGDTTARDLARLAGACLAGLDLAVVPADLEGVAGLILEVAAYSRSKRKPLGVRIIPLEGVEPGDKIQLARFGETPVIPI